MTADLNLDTQTESTSTVATLIDRVWVILVRPWLLLILAGLTLLLTTTAIFLPQLPGQLMTDPVSASRWFLTTANEYGAFGTTLRDLGLFDFSHSMILRVLLAGLGLLLLVHTGEMAGRAWALQRLPRLSEETPGAVGQPLPVALNGPRSRVVADQPAPVQAATVAEQLSARFPDLRTTTHPLAVSEIPGPDGPVPLLGEKAEAPAVEYRLLGMHHLWAAWLRVAGGVGLVLGLAGLWFAVNLGWAVDLPLLTPGATFTYTPESLALAYTVPSGRPPAELQVTVGSSQMVIVPDSARRSARMGSLFASARSVAPGLLIVTNGASLAPAGQSQLVRQVGLLFPTPGAEETVTLPGQESALRLVRLPGVAGDVAEADATFLVELFDSSSLVSGQPVQRLEIRGNEGSSIFLDGGRLQIAFLPMPGLTVSVRAMPGLWILWPALLLIILGAIGFTRRPAFVLAQIAPWPVDRSVVVVQGDGVRR